MNDRTHAEVSGLARVPRSAGAGPQRHALIIANRLPFPLDDGWKVRTFHVVRGVALHQRVTLVVFHPAEDHATIETARQALGTDVHLVTLPPPAAYTPTNLLRGLFTPLPVHVWNQESAEMRAVIQKIISNDPFDILVAESTFMAGYLDLVPASVPHIIDTHNIDSVTFARYVSTLPHGPRRWYAAATVRRIAALETRTFRDANAVWVCSEVERELAQRMAPGSRVLTVPNGVDTDAFAPAPDVPVAASRLLFFGRLDYYPNTDGIAFFAREILPRVKAARSDVELQVVGAAATREVTALAEAEPALRLIGRVDDLRDALAAAAVVIVPLRVGGGTRLKILEALSMARPIVTTTIGAEGLPVEHGRHLLIADTAQDFATAIISLLDDSARAEQLGTRGRALVREHFDWTHVHRLVADSMDQLVGTGHK